MPKLLLLLAFFALFACKEDSNYDVLALAYAELRVATYEYGDTEDGRAVRFQILEKHGFTTDSFEKKTEELKKEPDKWLIFQKAVMDILDTIAKLDTIAQ